MSTPPTAEKAAAPLVNYLADKSPITSPHFMKVLSLVGSVVVVYTNWQRVDGWKGLAKQAMIGASCGYGIARFTRDVVNRFRPETVAEANVHALAQIENSVNLTENKLGLEPHPLDTLPARVENVRKGVATFVHHYGALKREQQLVKQFLDSNSGNGTALFAQAAEVVAKEIETAKAGPVAVPTSPPIGRATREEAKAAPRSEREDAESEGKVKPSRKPRTRSPESESGEVSGSEEFSDSRRPKSRSSREDRSSRLEPLRKVSFSSHGSSSSGKGKSRRSLHRSEE